MDDDDLTPSEAAHEQKRDRRAGARQRRLMDSGAAKLFKQILDRQSRVAREAEGRSTRRDAKGRRRGPKPDDAGTP